MDNKQKINTALEIMMAFARETGLDGDAEPRRYLWTDAYAVENFLALNTISSQPRMLQYATGLVSQVHEVLGKHRRDDVRQGWLSGLDDASASKHPTVAGLRIGKPLPERKPDEVYDAQTEWDRDGQYYHYLTRWMQALHDTEYATGVVDYGRWAGELAEAAFNGFMSKSTPHHLMWKMSIDLSRPLVSAAGHHDPLDGFVTALVLHQTHPDNQLQKIIEALRPFCLDQNWVTNDPLGIGGLLSDAQRLVQLDIPSATAGLLKDLSGDILKSLQHFMASPTLGLPASQRLAFRELGLTIGLRQIDASSSLIPDADLAAGFDPLASYIESFWLDETNQQQATWQSHLDINRVMLASSLLASVNLQPN